MSLAACESCEKKAMGSLARSATAASSLADITGSPTRCLASSGNR